VPRIAVHIYANQPTGCVYCAQTLKYLHQMDKKASSMPRLYKRLEWPVAHTRPTPMIYEYETFLQTHVNGKLLENLTHVLVVTSPAQHTHICSRVRQVQTDRRFNYKWLWSRSALSLTHSICHRPTAHGRLFSTAQTASTTSPG